MLTGVLNPEQYVVNTPKSSRCGNALNFRRLCNVFSVLGLVVFRIASLPGSFSNGSKMGVGEAQDASTIATIPQAGGVQHVELTREEQRGSWIGNTWIPPTGWRYYSAVELRTFYAGKSVMWTGDSTSRRTFASMYGILNATGSLPQNASTSTGPSSSSPIDVSVNEINSARIIDVNKAKMAQEKCTMFAHIEERRRPGLCRITPGDTMTPTLTTSRGVGIFSHKHTYCFKDVETFVQDELSGRSNITAGVDVMILAMGIWEQVRSKDCQDPLEQNPKRSVVDRQNAALDLLGKLQSPHLTIIVRTSGFHTHEKPGFILDLNKRTMDKIDQFTSELWHNHTIKSNLTYVDWGGAVFPRSIGKEKIRGDMHPHYGLEPRHVLVQMITNHLASRGFGEQVSLVLGREQLAWAR
jgi:hypothetical protein